MNTHWIATFGRFARRLSVANNSGPRISTIAPLDLSYPAIAIWAPNTGVGKTLISAALAVAATREGARVQYIKPVQTGWESDSDGSLVARAMHTAHVLGSHAAGVRGTPKRTLSPQSGADTGPSVASTLFAWNEPVSPHLAVEREGRCASDHEVVEALSARLRDFRINAAPGTAPSLALVETAGGVCSPAPSGTLQVDALRPLRLPAVLVADGSLGGIGTTLAALEALVARGYDVAAVVGWAPDNPITSGNFAMVQRYAGEVPAPEPPLCVEFPRCKDAAEPPRGGELDAELASWLQTVHGPATRLHTHLQAWHARRVAALRAAEGVARRALWWPFTQHATLSPTDVTVIDARAGEAYVALVGGDTPGPSCQSAPSARGSAAPARTPELAQLYDGCASWWTQGVSGELQPELMRHLAYGAGRYGHVIFPEAAHAAALGVAERLLRLVGGSWASRVFFSDDGSTAVEVALKIAFRLYQARRFAAGTSPASALHVAALTGGYHGDTLAAMDCAPASVFNEGQTPWYQPRGLFLEPPTCGLSRGAWTVRPPGSTCPAQEEVGGFSDMAALFSDERLSSEMAQHYEDRVAAALEAHEAATGAAIGACLIEPVMQGAGGMAFIDPLFQRVLVKVCRARGVPVIADEVFTGLWRLGWPSAMAALGAAPDVACFAKLLTGGTVPLAATLASEEAFDAFRGDSKAQALLHGHSYSAHAIGCQVGIGALDILGNPRRNPSLGEDGMLQALWPEATVAALSHDDRVVRVVCLGTVLALELRVAKGQQGGYASTVAKEVTARLRQCGVYARPLGNVVYLMCTPTTRPDVAARLAGALQQCL